MAKRSGLSLYFSSERQMKISCSNPLKNRTYVLANVATTCVFQQAVVDEATSPDVNGLETLSPATGLVASSTTFVRLILSTVCQTRIRNPLSSQRHVRSS